VHGATHFLLSIVDLRTSELEQSSGFFGFMGKGIGPCNFSQILSSSKGKVKTSTYLISPLKIYVFSLPFLPILTYPEQTKSKVTSSTYVLVYLRSDK
jgi:hypothetical protein